MSAWYYNIYVIIINLHICACILFISFRNLAGWLSAALCTHPINRDRHHFYMCPRRIPIEIRSNKTAAHDRPVTSLTTCAKPHPTASAHHDQLKLFLSCWCCLLFFNYGVGDGWEIRWPFEVQKYAVFSQGRCERMARTLMHFSGAYKFWKFIYTGAGGDIWARLKPYMKLA